MKVSSLLLALLLSGAGLAVAQAQSPLRVLVRDERTKTVLPGFGYKASAIFSGATEQQAHANVRPLDVVRLRAETSRGLNADVTVRGRLEESNVSLNQAVFHTRLHHPLIPDSAPLALGITDFRNAASPVTARGLETNLRLALDALQFFTAYTFTDTRQTYDPGQPAELPFVSRHRLVLTSVFEQEKNFRLDLESTSNDPLYLGEGARWGRGFWLLGVLGEKMFAPRFSVVLNVENLLDARQTRFEPVVLGPPAAPTFRPLYAPLDGVVGNMALKITV